MWSCGLSFPCLSAGNSTHSAGKCCVVLQSAFCIQDNDAGAQALDDLAFVAMRRAAADAAAPPAPLSPTAATARSLALSLGADRGEGEDDSRSGLAADEDCDTRLPADVEANYLVDAEEEYDFMAFGPPIGRTKNTQTMAEEAAAEALLGKVVDTAFADDADNLAPRAFSRVPPARSPTSGPMLLGNRDAAFASDGRFGRAGSRVSKGDA